MRPEDSYGGPLSEPERRNTSKGLRGRTLPALVFLLSFTSEIGRQSWEASDEAQCGWPPWACFSSVTLQKHSSRKQVPPCRPLFAQKLRPRRDPAVCRPRGNHQDAVQRVAEMPGLRVNSAQQITAEVAAAAATRKTSGCGLACLDIIGRDDRYACSDVEQSLFVLGQRLFPAGAANR